MTVLYRPLGKIGNIIQTAGFDMSYAYDDLVFSDHSVFILRFDAQKDTDLHLYFNTDCDKKEVLRFEQKLKASAKTEGFAISSTGSFSIEQLEGKEELEIKFSEH